MCLKLPLLRCWTYHHSQRSNVRDRSRGRLGLFSKINGLDLLVHWWFVYLLYHGINHHPWPGCLLSGLHCFCVCWVWLQGGDFAVFFWCPDPMIWFPRKNRNSTVDLKWKSWVPLRERVPYIYIYIPPINLDYIMVVLGQLPSTNLHKASIMTLKYITLHVTVFNPMLSVCIQGWLEKCARRIRWSSVWVPQVLCLFQRKVRTEGPKGKRGQSIL